MHLTQISLLVQIFALVSDLVSVFPSVFKNSWKMFRQHFLSPIAANNRTALTLSQGTALHRTGNAAPGFAAPSFEHPIY